jgi:hypothetical protein
VEPFHDLEQDDRDEMTLPGGAVILAGPKVEG